jgi:FeS assembly SUF system protein
MNEMASSEFEAESDAATVAKAGEPLPPGITPASKEAVIEALKTVYDPEIPVDIYELGLIYSLDVDQENGNVTVAMTLTAPACPVAGTLPPQVANTISAVKGTGEVTVALVWEPPWNMGNMSEDARMALNLY